MSDQDMIPSRKMSGRRSKPSMELLKDNQRLLTNISVPQKRKRALIPKITYNKASQNISTVKVQRTNKSNNESNNAESYSKDDSAKDSQKKTLFVSLEVSKDIKQSNKSEENYDPEDDIPLSKVFPICQSNLSKESPEKPKVHSDKPKESSIKKDKIKDIHSKKEKFKENSEKKEKSKEHYSEKKEKMKENYSEKKEKTKENYSEKKEKMKENYSEKKEKMKENVEKPKLELVLPPKKKIKYNPELNGGNNSSSANTVVINSSKSVYKKETETSPKKTAVNNQTSISLNNKTENEITPIKVVNNSITKIDVLSMPKIPKKTAIIKTVTDDIIDNNNSNLDIKQNSPPKTKLEENITSSLSKENDKIEDMEKIESPEPIKSTESPKCIRENCKNEAIDSILWNNEFCSERCAVNFSKQFFQDWLSKRKNGSTNILQSNDINKSI